MIIPNFQLLSFPNLESSSVFLCLELYVQAINKSCSLYHQNIFRTRSLSLTPLLTPLSHLPSYIIWIVVPAPNWTPCLCPCLPPVCSRGARMDFRSPFWPLLLLLYPENTLFTKMLAPCFPQSPPGTFFHMYMRLTLSFPQISPCQERLLSIPYKITLLHHPFLILLYLLLVIICSFLLDISPWVSE